MTYQVIKLNGCRRSVILFKIMGYLSVLYSNHRRRIKTEEKAKVVAVFLVTNLNAALTIQQQGRFEQKILEEHPFCQGDGLVWCELDEQPFRQLAVILFFFFNHPGAKQLVRQGAAMTFAFLFCIFYPSSMSLLLPVYL